MRVVIAECRPYVKSRFLHHTAQLFLLEEANALGVFTLLPPDADSFCHVSPVIGNLPALLDDPAADLRLIVGHECISKVYGIEKVENERTTVRRDARDLLDDGEVAVIIRKVSKACEEVHDELERSLAKRKDAHVATYEFRGGRFQAGKTEQYWRQVEADCFPTGCQYSRVSASAARKVEHAVHRSAVDEPLYQLNSMLRFCRVAMRIQRKILLAEPGFEPLRHRRESLVVGLAADDRPCPVELFRKHEPCKLMGQRPRRERQSHH